mgnify:FL=1
MELTQRQNEILKTLLSNAFVSIKDLAVSFDISVATLKNDIDLINESIYPKSHIYLKSNSKYYLDNKAPFVQENYYLSDTLLYDNQIRFNEILGYLLTHDYAKLEDLERELNLERSTFLPYLKLVKQQLKSFDIQVLSKPKYGYYLSYTEENYRYAYILYLTLSKSPIYAEDEIYKEVYRLIKERQLDFNDTKFIQLYYYLKFRKDRNIKGYFLENENQLFEIILEIFNLNEHDYKYALKNESIKDLHDLFVIYLKENGLSVLLEECHTSIFDFVLKAYLKNKYHIYLNVTPNQLDSIPKNSPISIFLARKILDFVKIYDESDVYELANILYNEIVTRHYTYQKLKLLIVSSLNKTSHESLKYRLFNRYSSYIESIDNAHFYELSEDLVNNYDAVLYFQKDGMILPGYIKKKCALDYFINYNDFSEIFEELIVPHFIYKNPFDFNHEIKKIKYKNTNELKNYSIEIYNQVGITILFTKEKPETIYYSFDKMQKLNGRKIKEGFIFIVNIQDDMLSLKMAENFLRLITQSKQAKDYVIQETGDVYTKVLHHRRQFV